MGKRLHPIQAGCDPRRISNRTKGEQVAMTPEQEGGVGLVVLLLATLGLGALVNGIIGNATVAFIACVAFFGVGLQVGDKLLKR
jgi:hypothetical protein